MVIFVVFLHNVLKPVLLMKSTLNVVSSLLLHQDKTLTALLLFCALSQLTFFIS